jgi:hypothetical protein
MRAFRCSTDITGSPAPSVCVAPYNISPPLEIQLVLELNVQVLVMESVEVLPGG